MKKLSIILLALAITLVYTVSAMAIHIGDIRDPQGAIGINGQYVLDGEKVDYDGAEAAWYDNDVDVNFVWTMGDVTVKWRAELDDTEGLQGDKNNKGIVDDLWVSYKLNDALTFKFGEYYIGSSAIADDTTGGFNIQANYGLDSVDLMFAVVKKSEDGGFPDAATDEDDDTDRMVLSASFSEAGPLTKLALTYVTEDNQVTEEGATFMLLDAAVPAGPVTLGLQYGSFGGTVGENIVLDTNAFGIPGAYAEGDDAEGNYMMVDIGLEELLGFDLSINYFVASDDLYGGWQEDYAPFQLIQDEVVLFDETSQNMTTIAVKGSYAYNDKLSFSGAYIMATVTDDVVVGGVTLAEGGDDIGTEIDAIATYKIADNVTYKAAIGSFSEGDLGFGDMTKYFNRLTVTF
jgi:hypothetical protein